MNTEIQKHQAHENWERDAEELLQRLEKHWHDNIHPEQIRQRLIELLLSLKHALARDSDDARFVVATYRRYLKHQASREEQARANMALKRMLGEIGVVIVSILPFAFVTLPGLFALARRFDIQLLPDQSAAPCREC